MNKIPTAASVLPTSITYPCIAPPPGQGSWACSPVRQPRSGLPRRIRPDRQSAGRKAG